MCLGRLRSRGDYNSGYVFACMCTACICVCVRVYNECVCACVCVCVFAILLFEIRYVFVVYVCDAVGRGSNELVLARWLVVDPGDQGSFGLEDGPFARISCPAARPHGGKEPASCLLLHTRRIDVHAVLRCC